MVGVTRESLLYALMAAQLRFVLAHVAQVHRGARLFDLDEAQG
jgi:hypothetical protein